MKDTIIRDASIEIAHPTSDGDVEIEKLHQTLTFDSHMLPQLVDWEVGMNYTLVIEVKQKSRHTNLNSDSATFKVLGVGVHEEEIDILEAEVKEQLKI